MKLMKQILSFLYSILFFCLSFGVNYSNAQSHANTACHFYEPNTAPREHPLDMERVKLIVSFDCPKGIVYGKVVHTFKVLRNKVDTVFFDGPGITIKEAYLGKNKVPFRTSAKGVTVIFPQTLTWDTKDSITFVFTSQPRKGIYFIGWNDPNNLSRKQVWTQGQGIDHRHWFPCYDDANDKVITETITTFDKEYRVLSNGTLRSIKDNKDKTRTWHYEMTRPHALYLLMLGIGNYSIMETKTKTGVPVNLWYYPDHKDKFEPTYRYSTECIEFLEEHTGIKYPWESYSQIPVQDFIYGAMENTTATVFGDFFCVDKRDFHDRNYIGVNVHELTHQWFGDLITGRSTNNTWLQESFATFYPKIFSRKYFGEDVYQMNRRGEQRGSLEASKKDNNPIYSNSGGTSRVYGKGSTVLDMMMYVFGEDQYKRVIHHYLKKHSFKNVETNDLYQSFQDTLGLSPDWFFDQWIYRGGEPHYEVSYQKATINAVPQTLITVKQIHPLTDLVKLFKMPFVFEVHYTDGTKSEKYEWIENQTTTVSIENIQNKSISYVLFDPGSYVLKNVTFIKSYEELKNQAKFAKNVVDRFDAVLAMKNLESSSKTMDLIHLYDNEKYPGLRAEIMSQLLSDSSEQVKSLVKKALDDIKEIDVHKAIIANTETISAEMKPYFEKLLTDSSYNTIANALEKLCLNFPEDAKRYFNITKSFYGNDNRVKIKWLEMNCIYGDKNEIDKLVDYTSNSYEFRTRSQAIEALKRLNYLDEKAIENLFEASTNPNGRLAAVSNDVLKYFLAQHEHKTMLMESYKKSNLPAEKLELLKHLY